LETNQTITISLIAILAWISLMHVYPNPFQEERGSSDYSTSLYLFGISAAKSDWLNYLTVLASFTTNIYLYSLHLYKTT